MQESLEDTPKRSRFEFFKRGFVSGLGWTFGATFGFLIISTILIVILRQLGGLPLIGSFIASLVEATLKQLYLRNPVF